MTTPAINLYTSKPASGLLEGIAALLSQTNPINLCDISDMPPPDRKRSRARKTALVAELLGLRAYLDATLYLIRLAENYMHRFGHELPRLRRERDNFELEIEKKEKELAGIEELLKSKKGGKQA